MIRRPPRSTLIPYTDALPISFTEVGLLAGVAVDENGGSQGGMGVDTDRKSTRLNSSHGYISYAVFCLKKKNTTGVTIARPLPEALIILGLLTARVLDGRLRSR